MKKSDLLKLLMVVTLFFSTVTQAGTIAFRQVGVGNEEWQEFLQKNPQYQAANEQLESEHYDSALYQSLRRQFIEAQKNYLEGNVPLAVQNFTQVIDSALKQDWKEEDREVFFYSALRLSQIESDPLKKNDWLEWACTYAPDLKPDGNVFDPTLILNWSEMQKKLKPKALSISLASFDGFDWIKINGKKFRLPSHNEIQVWPGNHRVSWVSSVYGYITRNMNASQLSVFEVPRLSIVSGSCQVPEYNGPNKHKNNFAAIFAGGCTYSGHKDLLSLNSNGSSDIATRQISKPLFKNKWTWIGLAALSLLVAGGAYYLNQQRRTTNPPEPVVATPAETPTSEPVHQPVQPTQKNGF